jgi:hypothetical protein
MEPYVAEVAPETLPHVAPASVDFCHWYVMVPPAVPVTEKAVLESVAPSAEDTSLGCAVMSSVSVCTVAEALSAT